VPASRCAVDAMNAKQAPRGPDGEGVWVSRNVALGHRRLKILDLSDRASQPMEDAALGLTIVFNGCIYNFQTLRRELAALGHQFSTTSDTEVLLKAYAEWGEQCLHRLNGMFAFAVYEHDSGNLFIARDRLGIKPLYYSETAQRFRFASSLPALLAVHDGSTEIDASALHNYLTFHSVVPAPHTMIRGFSKLPPATYSIVRPNGKRSEVRYWAPSFSRDAAADLDFEEAKERVLAALDMAVQRRIIADVPVGVLLSGGVDSSLVVGLLARNGVSGLNTFTVGFDDAGNEAGNEFVYSDSIAREFGTRHHRFEVTAKQLTENLPACFEAMSEPMTSHDNIAFYLLSRKVSEHVKVVESGQGADEIFGGYFWYPPLLDSCDAVADYAAGFCDRDHEDMQTLLQSEWISHDHSREFLRAHFDDADASLAVDKALHIDTTVMLVDDPVKRVDNMTMAWGLEARVPFLDHELVELACALPPQMKVGGEGKLVLKEAARAVIPNEVIDRPKGYFPVPPLKYLNGRVLTFVKDALSSRAATQRGLFRRGYLDKLLDAPTEHVTPLQGSKLWQVASLEIWLQTHLA